MRRLTTLFPSEFLEEHAEELGVVEREGKLQIPAFVWAFVFGFAAGESRTLAGFRRSYNSTADEAISPGGFYHRLTPTTTIVHHESAARRVRAGGSIPSQNPQLGVCPRCGDQIHHRHVLVEYGTGDDVRCWTECPGCGGVVDPNA